MIRYLSYPMKRINPVYGMKRKLIGLSPVKSLSRGDSSNTWSVTFENHQGTHVDCPAHFFKRGKKVTDYAADVWRFERPQVLDVSLDEGELLTTAHLRSRIRRDTDLLLLKSGWFRFRGQTKYSLRNPGIAPSFGTWLRTEQASVRAVGFDWISLSSYMDRETGRAAHRVFLNPKGKGLPVLVFEDMDLSADLELLKEVWAFPWRIEGLDSAPCTITGVFRD